MAEKTYISCPFCGEGETLTTLTLYRDDSTTQVVYEQVKHFFWTAHGTVLTIAQYVDLKTGEHRYIHWPRERICWFKDERAESPVPGAAHGKK